jgi:hypothetical protein
MTGADRCARIGEATMLKVLAAFIAIGLATVGPATAQTSARPGSPAWTTCVKSCESECAREVRVGLCMHRCTRRGGCS